MTPVSVRQSEFMMSADAVDALRAYNMEEAPRIQADLEQEKLVRERLFNMPAEAFRRSYVVICSIWPETLTSQPFHHGGMGRKSYTVDAGSPTNPAYLLVETTFDWITNNGPNGTPELFQGTIMAHQIAKDLIQYWTGDHPGNKKGKRGIGVIEGRLNAAGLVEATPEEIQELKTHQYNFLKYFIDTADALWDSGNPVQRAKISREHRKAFKMMGLDETQHPWVRNRVVRHSKCPACGEAILAEASLCKICRTNLISWFLDEFGGMTDEERERWPTVAAGIDRRLARQADVTVTEPKKGRKGGDLP